MLNKTWTHLLLLQFVNEVIEGWVVTVHQLSFSMMIKESADHYPRGKKKIVERAADTMGACIRSLFLYLTEVCVFAACLLKMLKMLSLVACVLSSLGHCTLLNYLLC